MTTNPEPTKGEPLTVGQIIAFAYQGFCDSRSHDGIEERHAFTGAVQAAVEAVDRLSASAPPCPHVRTSAEGTSYCELAESVPRGEAALREIAAKRDLCIYRRDENGGVDFREGSNKAFRECADIALAALAAARPAAPTEGGRDD